MDTSEWQDFHQNGLWKLVIAWGPHANTGLCEVKHASRLRQLHIRDGTVIGAASEDPADNLVQVFLDRQLFTLAQYLSASANFFEDKDLGQNLIHFGLITPSELEQGLQEQLYLIIKGTLYLPEGRCRFDAELPATKAVESRYELVPALVRAFLEFNDKQWVVSQFDASLDFRVGPGNAMPDALWEANWLKDFKPLRSSLRESFHFKDLVLEAEVPEFRLLKFLWIAAMLGYFEIMDGGEHSRLEAKAQPIQSDVEPLETLPEPKQKKAVSRRNPKSTRLMPWWRWSAGLVLLAMVLGFWWFWSSLAASREEQPNNHQVAGASQSLSDFNKPNAHVTEKPAVDSRPVAVAMARGDLRLATRLWQDQANDWQGLFTLGIYMVCDPENVFVLWESLAKEARFFVLPREYRERACYWVCWGQYDSRLDALAARSHLPAALQQVAPDAEAYLIEKLH